MNCKTCRWSFSIHDHEYRPVLMCWPDGKKELEQIAFTPCESYQRDVGDLCAEQTGEKI